MKNNKNYDDLDIFDFDKIDKNDKPAELIPATESIPSEKIKKFIEENIPLEFIADREIQIEYQSKAVEFNCCTMIATVKPETFRIRFLK
ncbi:MAG: hypothetical protein PHP23_05735 [Desulfobacterales bacterium]|nr:hypothetical protein [Desulfobacterales bacterium]MDD4071407.1 hypothetical protein [Desulfobacterales bacterium]MDD4391452.1 hypothetical protein [Desulfobacterales bacterium]